MSLEILPNEFRFRFQEIYGGLGIVGYKRQRNDCSKGRGEVRLGREGVCDHGKDKGFMSTCKNGVSEG